MPEEISPSDFLDLNFSEDTSTIRLVSDDFDEHKSNVENPEPSPLDDTLPCTLNKHVCSFCGLVSVSGAELKIHLLQHRKIALHKCQYCKHEFFRQSSFRNHRCSKVPKLCQHCGLNFQLRKDLKAHLKEKHTFQVPSRLYCPHCEFSCWSSVILNQHSKQHLGNKTLNCPHCPFQFSGVDNLQKHLKVHRTESSFVCPYCGLAFSKYGIVKIHMSIHKDAESFQCSFCDFKSPLKRNLSAHIRRVHESNNVYRCSSCSYVTLVKWRMKMHSFIHQKGFPKRHSCSSCSYTSNYITDLKRHISTVHASTVHASDKEYSCPSCLFKTSSLYNLKTHASRHTLPPPDFLKSA